MGLAGGRGHEQGDTLNIKRYSKTVEFSLRGGVSVAEAKNVSYRSTRTLQMTNAVREVGVSSLGDQLEWYWFNDSQVSEEKNKSRPVCVSYRDGPLAQNLNQPTSDDSWAPFIDALPSLVGIKGQRHSYAEFVLLSVGAGGWC